MSDIVQVGEFKVFCFVDSVVPRPIALMRVFDGGQVNVWLSVADARAVAAELVRAAKLAPIGCKICGEAIGESGVLKDDGPSCAACYLREHGQPFVLGLDMAEPGTESVSVSLSSFDGVLAESSTDGQGRGE